MKVYNKLVIDMLTMEVLEEDSFEYVGPVALCGGGGGSSGEIIYPEYMMGVHGAWLANDSAAPSVNYWMRAAFNHSPYDDAAYLPHDPATEISRMGIRWNSYYAVVEDLLLSTPLSGPVGDAIDAFTTKQDNELNTVVYPRFNAGMLDINAVQSSAFILGHANIEARKLDAVSEFSANVFMQHELSVRDHVKSLAHMGIELERISIIANSEYQTRRADQAAMDALWELEVFKYGCNVMACIGSASVHTGQRSVSAGQSALAGAMSGAAMGAMYGNMSGGGFNPMTTAIGAVVGGIAGYLGAA